MGLWRLMPGSFGMSGGHADGNHEVVALALLFDEDSGGEVGVRRGFFAP